MRKWFAAAAVAALLSLAPPASAQSPEADITRKVASFVRDSEEGRTEAALALVREAGFSPQIEQFEGKAGDKPRTGSNITFSFGAGPREILLVAHYDAVRLKDGSLVAGVVDNAASAVAMVEAAKLLRGAKLKHRVRVLLTDQEEQGLLGARAWIARHGVAQLAGVINADVAAYGESLMYGLNNGAQSAGLVRALREVCAERALDCEGYPIYPPSEDRAFSAAGAPVVSIGFQDAVGARQMWLMMNTPNTGFAEGFRSKVFTTIHTPADTLALLEPATVARAATVFADLVQRIDAGSPDKRNARRTGARRPPTGGRPPRP